MNTTCTCGLEFRDVEDWRDHMPCPGSELEIVREELKEVKLAVGETGDQNALLEMENDRLKQEIVKLNRFLMERSVGGYYNQHCSICGYFECPGAPRFKGICPQNQVVKDLRDDGDDWKIGFMLNAGHPKHLDPEGPACICGDYRCWGRHNPKV